MRTDELDYHLPRERIAARPVEPRDSARMLVHHLGDGTREHRHVRDLPEYLGPTDVVVFNRTAVIPARFVGRRADTGGRVEGLFLHARGDGLWEVMLRSNGRLAAGHRVALDDPRGHDAGAALKLVEPMGGGAWSVRPVPAGTAPAILDVVGRTPLPPYILKARGAGDDLDARDRDWYQTVYADPDRRRSVAAPTAGLHFTPGLLDAIDARGARRDEVTLHVGPGTFKPITAETIDEHEMHEEWFEVPAGTLASLRGRRRDPASTRLLAVGTTSVRALESLPDPIPEALEPIAGRTDLLIAPPYRFRHVDGLLTNFHLPRSTLLALVAALVGLDTLLDLYRDAVDRGYRFYSYGDAMLILPE